MIPAVHHPKLRRSDGSTATSYAGAARTLSSTQDAPRKVIRSHAATFSSEHRLNSLNTMKNKMTVALGLLALTLTALAADIGGIGVVIVDRRQADEPLRTGKVFPGSPAERAGIKPNWFLISVNGTNVVSMSLTQSMSLVRGPVGTALSLELADPGMNHTNQFTAKRARMVFRELDKPEFFDK